jgi:hypothetical protein
MGVSLPHDVLLCIAHYLDIDNLRDLLAVSPAFCHLAMKARYGAVIIEELNGYETLHDSLMIRTTRLRYSSIIGIIHTHSYVYSGIPLSLATFEVSL